MESNPVVLRAVIWFFWKKGFKPVDIHRELAAVCGDDGPLERTVQRWVSAFDNGRDVLEDNARSGRPVTAVTQSK